VARRDTGAEEEGDGVAGSEAWRKGGGFFVGDTPFWRGGVPDPGGLWSGALLIAALSERDVRYKVRTPRPRRRVRWG
jgi:hypothetical protein